MLKLSSFSHFCILFIIFVSCIFYPNFTYKYISSLFNCILPSSTIHWVLNFGNCIFIFKFLVCSWNLWSSLPSYQHGYFKLFLITPISRAASIIHCLGWIYSCSLDCCSMSIFYCSLVLYLQFWKKNKWNLQMVFFLRFSFKEDLILYPVDTRNSGSFHVNFRIDMIWSWAAVTVRAYHLLVYPGLYPFGHLNQSAFTHTALNTRLQSLWPCEDTVSTLSHSTKIIKYSKGKSELKSQAHILSW